MCRYCVDISLRTSSVPNQFSINILSPPPQYWHPPGRDSVTYGGQQLFITTLHTWWHHVLPPTLHKYEENEDPEAVHLLIVLCFTELSWILCSSGCHLLQHCSVVGDGDDGSTDPTCSCEHPINVCTARSCRYTEEYMLDILDRHQSGAHQGSTSDAKYP